MTVNPPTGFSYYNTTVIIGSSPEVLINSVFNSSSFLKLGSAIFLNIFKELLVALPKRPTRWTKVFTKMEEEEDF